MNTPWGSVHFDPRCVCEDAGVLNTIASSPMQRACNLERNKNGGTAVGRHQNQLITGRGKLMFDELRDLPDLDEDVKSSARVSLLSDLMDSPLSRKSSIQSPQEIAFSGLPGFDSPPPEKEPSPDKKGDAGSKPEKKDKPVEKPLSPKPVSDETRRSIETLEKAVVDNLTNHSHREQFNKDLAFFRGRVGRDLSEQEFRSTVEKITDLLNSKDASGGQSKERRVLGARGLMYNLGHPDTLGQLGSTCGAGSIERVLCQSKPSLAADMVCSVLKSGEWTGRDGVKVTVPKVNLVPEGAQLLVPPRLAERELGSHPCTFASQVFLSTMVNEIGQHFKPARKYERTKDQEEWVLPDGKRVDFSAAGSTGVHGELSMTGGLPSAVVITALRRITGHDARIIINPDYDIDKIPDAKSPVDGIKSDGIEKVRSAAELQATLERLQKDGKFPVVVSISSAACFEAVSINAGSAPRKPDAEGPFIPDHFVTIHGYNAGPPPRVELRNSWGKEFNAPVPVDFLFQALGTRKPEPRKPQPKPESK